MYNEATIRKKARNVGYRISKGKIHFLNSYYPVAFDEVGYNVFDEECNTLVWGCFNNVYDHLLTLEDIDERLRGIYSDLGLIY